MAKVWFYTTSYKKQVSDFFYIASACIISLCLLSVSFYEHSYFLRSILRPTAHRPFFFVIATIKALLFYVAGSAAYGIPLLLIFKVYVSHVYRWHEVRLRFYAALGFLITFSCLEAWHSVRWSLYPYSPGGLLGYSGVRVLSFVFDTTLIGTLLCIWLVSFFLVMVHLSGVMFMGKAIFFVLQSVRSLCAKLRLMSLWHTGKQKVASYVHTYRKPRAKNTMHHSFVEMAYQTVHDDAYEEVIQDEWWRTIATAHTQSKMTTVSEEPASKEHESVMTENGDGAFLYASNTDINSPAYIIPPVSLLTPHESHKHGFSADQQAENERAQIIENKLAHFGIEGRVVAIKYGPVITLFEYQPEVTAKISKILALEDDLALALQAASIRIIAPIPGKNVVGFEVARAARQRVDLSALMHTSLWLDDKKTLPLILGVDTVGNLITADLASMPHLLVAGATGAGKSVALNSMLISLLGKKSPDQLKLILIDPKQLEFSPYYDIAHLLFPIVTHVPDAQAVLEWLVGVMQERYTTMASAGARSIGDYNALAPKKGVEPFAYVVVVIDELADLMLLIGKSIEQTIARLVQMARAAGIHMVVATQRPSVDVITGTIKANFACRLACRVASKIDSRTIIDTVGAEKLLGKGDMLYLDATGLLNRIHGAYVSDQEVEIMTEHIRVQQTAVYQAMPESEIRLGSSAVDGADQKLLQDIIAYIQSVDEISISSLQRVFKIGYNRAARMIELLEQDGRVLAASGTKMRKVVK